MQPKCGNHDVPGLRDQGACNINVACCQHCDFECMSAMATDLTCKFEYLDQLQQVSEHLPLAVLLLS